MFVSGHPGSTDRTDTVAELETQRDIIYPYNIQVVKRRLDVLRAVCERAAPRRRGRPRTSSSASRTRSRPQTGEYNGLLDPKIMAKKAADERALRDSVAPQSGVAEAYASGVG